jgi:thiol-disulfide isomerase/thioredoxin
MPGEYSDYAAEKVGTANGTVLLFFHASWCPQCREIEASIERDGLPNNVTVLKVDYDSNQILRQRYGVTLQTTFVKVDASGSKIASYVAYEEPRFSAVARELLP